MVCLPSEPRQVGWPGELAAQEGAMERMRAATSRGDLAAYGAAAARTWATASSGAAVASRRIPRHLAGFFAFSFTFFCLQNFFLILLGFF